MGVTPVAPRVRAEVDEAELLRVIHPGGKAILGERELTKPAPEGVDSWSHPYHGPDNNPFSEDAIIKAPYLTQFLADPCYIAMPSITTAAGGRSIGDERRSTCNI